MSLSAEGDSRTTRRILAPISIDWMPRRGAAADVRGTLITGSFTIAVCILLWRMQGVDPRSHTSVWYDFMQSEIRPMTPGSATASVELRVSKLRKRVGDLLELLAYRCARIRSTINRKA